MSLVDKIGNHKSFVNLAQLYTAIQRKKHKKFLQYIIEKQDDINYQIPVSDYLQLHHPELIGCTALHLAFSKDNFDIFNLLLSYRPDLNLQNHKQMTVLCRTIEENFNQREITQLRCQFNEYTSDFTIEEVNSFVVVHRIIEGNNFNRHDNWRLWGKVGDQYMSSILSACLETKNVPKCSDSDFYYAACLMDDVEAVEFFLKNGGEVNATSSSPIFDGFTPLHFAVKYSSVKMLEILLANGVNLFTCENEATSPVSMLVDQNLKIMEWLQAKNTLPYKKSIFDYMENEAKLITIMNKNFKSDENNFSGFHIACTMANMSSIILTCSARGPLTLDTFLEGDQWYVYDRIPEDSTDRSWSGYTALHFAAFFNMETAKLLINSGADIEAKNKSGVTPMDILETRATIDDLHFIVSRKEVWKNVTLINNITLLDVISSMKYLHTFVSFLDQTDQIYLRIPDDSPLWPGYTILHLVVTFSETVKKVEFLKNVSDCNERNFHEEYENCCREQETNYLEKIKTCLKKSTDVTVQDTRGRTPINLAFRQRNMEAVNLMLQDQDETVNPTDDDNLSHLHIACLAKNSSMVEKFLLYGADLNAAIKSSFKWHCDYHRCTATDVFDLVGSTPLHLAVSSGDIDSVKLLLKHGADVNAKDALGLTPLHRIFILQRLWGIGNELFRVRKSRMSFFRRSDSIKGYSSASKILGDIVSLLLSTPSLQETIVDSCGFSHLHVAVYENNIEAAEKLLNLGSDVNSVISCPKNLEANHPLYVLCRYDGYTPLHMSGNRLVPQMEKLLLERGADFLVTRTDGMNRLFDKLKDPYPENIAFYVTALKENETLRRRLQDRFGWTILHVASQLVDFDLAEVAYSMDVDVNSRTSKDSPWHPGCTALHILMKNCGKANVSEEMKRSHGDILTTLLDNGADVMLTDVSGNTALHQSDYIYGCKQRSYSESKYTGRVLQCVKDFSINPINHEGISTFHIACIRHDVDAVSKFLEHAGVDVNQPIEFFSDYMAGYTPLHLAIRFRSKSSGDVESQLQTIALLLKHGANVNVEDAFGDTPLHATAEVAPPRDAIFEMLVSHGAKVNVENIFGKTPLESLLSSRSATNRELEFFLKQGCRFNSFNEVTQVGYLSLLIQNIIRTKDLDCLKVALSCPSIRQVDYKGRTAVHNHVSLSDFPSGKNNLRLIRYLEESGYDIDSQDISGMTALHLAARFRNYAGVEALLAEGCDVNIVDSTGRTAFAYTLESDSLCDLLESPNTHNHHLVIYSLARFVYHMVYRRLYVNDVNRQTLTRALGEFIQHHDIEEHYRNIKKVKIGDTGFILDDFLSETSAIVLYPKISREDRKNIEEFFTNTVYEHIFHDWTSLCRLQYGKALQRAELVGSAKDAVNVAMGFPLPDLCYEVIEKFLSNADLKSLIAATSC